MKKRIGVTELPKSVKLPSPPSQRSQGRSLVEYITPLFMTAGFGVMMALTGRWLFLPLMALGPLFMVVDGLRRRRAEARDKVKQEVESG